MHPSTSASGRMRIHVFPSFLVKVAISTVTWHNGLNCRTLEKQKARKHAVVAWEHSLLQGCWGLWCQIFVTNNLYIREFRCKLPFSPLKRSCRRTEELLRCLPFSDVNLFVSSVFPNTFTANSSASFKLVSFSLYSCFSILTAACSGEKLSETRMRWRSVKAARAYRYVIGSCRAGRRWVQEEALPHRMGEVSAMTTTFLCRFLSRGLKTGITGAILVNVQWSFWWNVRTDISPHCCCQYRFLSIHRSFHSDHSDTAESRNACPTPCTRSTHQTASCLKKKNIFTITIGTLAWILFSQSAKHSGCQLMLNEPPNWV